MTVARTCVHYQTTPIYGYGRPRELNPEEFHDCCNKLNNSIYTCATTSHFKAQSAAREETENKIGEQREKTISEAAANINNREKPLKRFCDNSHVSKNKPFNDCIFIKQNKQDSKKTIFVPPQPGPLYLSWVPLQNIFMCPITL